MSLDTHDDLTNIAPRTNAELIAEMAANIETLKRENDILTNERDDAQQLVTDLTAQRDTAENRVNKIAAECVKLSTSHSEMMDERDKAQDALRIETTISDELRGDCTRLRQTLKDETQTNIDLTGKLNEVNVRLFQVRVVAHDFELRATAAEAVLAAQKPARAEPTVTVPVSVIQGHQSGAMANGRGYDTALSWYQP